jgi:peptidoglycan/LPS O-acetylase OafA/YrhL
MSEPTLDALRVGRSVDSVDVARQRTVAMTERVPAFDGLRACAIILVLMYHLMPGHNSDQGVGGAAFKVADTGWAGVDLFFVLSGYLITDILLRAKQQGHGLVGFWVRRLARIVPAYFLALAIVGVVVPLVWHAYELPPARIQAPYWLYVSNFLSGDWLKDASGARLRAGHFWSLSLEMQFYLLWPLCVYRLKLRQLMIMTGAAVLVTLALRFAVVFAGSPWYVQFSWTPLRCTGLLVGAFVALLCAQGWNAERHVRLAGATAAIAAAPLLLVAWFGVGYVVFRGDEPWEMLLRAALPVCASVSFGGLLLVILHRGAAQHVLSSRVFAPIARYSYGMYIAHYLMVPLMEERFGPPVLAQYISGRDAPVYLYFGLSSVLVFLVAAASYELFEVRILRWARRRQQ